MESIMIYRVIAGVLAVALILVLVLRRRAKNK
jgi:hypothetical protein